MEEIRQARAALTVIEKSPTSYRKQRAELMKKDDADSF